MKYYIFFTYTVKKIGGSQLYLKTKTDFLKRNGWNVLFFYCQNGDCFIKELLDNSYFIDELSKPSYLYFKFVRRRILKSIINCLSTIEKEDTVWIESHATYLSTWAEHLARFIKAKHFVYNIDEKPICPNVMSDFYNFKVSRQEFAGIFPESSSSFLKSGGIYIPTEKTPSLPAYGADECIVDVDYKINFDSNLYTIGLIGRLEKEYMRLTSPQIIGFLNKHKDKRFNLVFVGDEISGSKIKNEIIMNFRNITNVNIFFTGFLFPIPQILIKNLNVCIASAGTVFAVTQEGTTTITIDPRDLKANGVYGITTTAIVFSNEKKYELSELLENVYISPFDYCHIEPRSKYHFEEHIDFVNNSVQSKLYNTSFDKFQSIRTQLTRIILLFCKPSSINYIRRKFK